MSLANIPMGGMGGAASMTPFSMPQQQSTFSSATNGPAAAAPSSSYRMSGAVGKAEESVVQRGDLSGEDCFTLILDSSDQGKGTGTSNSSSPSTAIVCAVWQEEASKCVVHEKKVAASSILDRELLLELRQKVCALRGDEGKKKGKKSKAKPSVTFVLPTRCAQADIKAAHKLAMEAGCALKNVFSRSLAEVAGLLSRSDAVSSTDVKGSTSFLAEKLLLADKDDDHMCLHVRREADGSVSGAVVACEGSKIAKKRGNLLGLSRMANKKVVVLTDKGTAAVEVLQTLREYCAASFGSVAANCVVLSGGVVENDFNEQQKASSIFHLASDQDAVRGGCVLSAAELESSKQYINHVQDGWVLAYQLPVADSFLTQEIGLSVVTSAAQVDKDLDAAATAEPLFAAEQRLWKQEQGAIRLGSQLKALSLCRLFKYGSIYSSRSDAGAFPRLQLVSRNTAADPWMPLGEPFSPLQDSATKEAYSTCSVTISMEPHSGGYSVNVNRGDSIAEVKGRRYFWLQVAAFFAAIAALVGLYLAYLRWADAWEVETHRQWLLDFYRVNAPDKLKDMALIEKTLVKYKDRMFVLWRSLERTYNVKVKKPYGIVDEL